MCDCSSSISTDEFVECAEAIKLWNAKMAAWEAYLNNDTTKEAYAKASEAYRNHKIIVRQ